MSFVSDEMFYLKWMTIAGFLVLGPAIYFFKSSGAIVAVLSLTLLYFAGFVYLSAMGSAFGATIRYTTIFLYTGLALAYFAFLAGGLYLAFFSITICGFALCCWPAGSHCCWRFPDTCF